MMDRKISTSGQRLRALVHAASRTHGAGAVHASVTRDAHDADAILSRDSAITEQMRGIPPAIAGAPTMDDSSPNILPNNRLTAAASAITTAPPTKPGDMKAVMQRIRARQAATAQLAIDTEQHVETTMARCDALLMAAQAEANEVMDELNQLTNGGPV